MKDKGCAVCAGHTTILWTDFPDFRLFVDIAGGFLCVFDDQMPGKLEQVQIFFCPFCGRKLIRETGAAE